MILNVSVKPSIKTVYSSETNPKVWVQKSQAETEHPWAQTHGVNPSPGGPQEDKGSLLLWMGGSDNNWVWKHHMQEHTFRKIILILKCSPFYELKLYTIENWFIQSGLFPNTVSWKRAEDRSKRQAGTGRDKQSLSNISSSLSPFKITQVGYGHKSQTWAKKVALRYKPIPKLPAHKHKYQPF